MLRLFLRLVLENTKAVSGIILYQKNRPIEKKVLTGTELISVGRGEVC